MNATARVEGDAVWVDDVAQANRIHSKGHFGEPQSGNTLRLSRTEAAYLVHVGRLDAGRPWTELLDDEVAYFAYADLRDRGLVVRHDGDGFLVWQRGQGPKQEAWFRFLARSEREPATLDGLEEGVVGVVDEDGGVTHYLVEAARPEGSVMAVDIDKVAGVMLADRVLVEGRPFAAEFIGTPHGDHTVLSFTEAESLRRRGLLDVPDDLAAHAAQRQLHFDQTLPVYLDLRAHGAVARSGFRFGTHLRGYPRDPDSCHAEWLVQCVAADEGQHWSHLSRAVRLAHGVRKTFLLAGGEPVRYMALSWFRP